MTDKLKAMQQLHDDYGSQLTAFAESIITSTTTCKTTSDPSTPNRITSRSIVVIQKTIDELVGALPKDYDYFEVVKQMSLKADSSINTILPIMAFDGPNPTRCLAAKYNMCVIINPSDEFTFVESADAYIGWKEENNIPTNPVVNKLIDKIADSTSVWTTDNRENFIKYKDLYHKTSQPLTADAKTITAKQMFGNNQKMLPLSVTLNKIKEI